MCKCPHRPEEGIGSISAGLTGGCELPDMGAGTSTRAAVFLTAEPSLQPFVDHVVLSQASCQHILVSHIGPVESNGLVGSIRVKVREEFYAGPSVP